MAGGWYLKLTLRFVATHDPLHLDKRSFLQWKIMDINTSFIWIIIFFNGTFEYGDGGIFKLLSWMQNLHKSKWDHNILYSNRSSEEELLKRPLVRESKNMNMAGVEFYTSHFILWGELMNRCT
jgi:hypothetical protein